MFSFDAAQLQAIQSRLPHSLGSDVLMANCAWEYIHKWNKDPELIFSYEQAVAYLRCLQNAVLQHGKYLKTLKIGFLIKHNLNTLNFHSLFQTLLKKAIS